MSEPCSTQHTPRMGSTESTPLPEPAGLERAFLRALARSLPAHELHSVSAVCLKVMQRSRQSEMPILLAVAAAATLAEALPEGGRVAPGSCRQSGAASPCPPCGRLLAAQVPSAPAHPLNRVCKPICSPHLGQVSQIHFPLCIVEHSG